MSKKAVGQPVWDAKRKHWRLTKTINGKQRSFYSSNPSRRLGPAECRRKMQECLDSLDVTSMTFAEAWNEYMDYYAEKNKPTSVKQIEGKAKAHLLPVFEHRKLSSIKKEDWQAVIFRAHDNGAKSQVTLNNIATTIRTFCKWCAVKGYISDHDVPLYFEIPARKRKQEKKILQPEDFALLLSPEQDDADWYINAWRFLAVTGIRRGELCALQLKRDYDGDYIDIKESISHEQIVTSGKTAEAQRHIRLGDLAKECIRKHEMQLMQIGRRNRKYLFCDENGERISPRVLRNHWQAWREANGIYLTLHELRHTYISYSRLKTNIALEDLKKLYGHSVNMDTDRTYVHAINESVEEKQARIEQEKRDVNQIDAVIKTIISQA